MTVTAVDNEGSAGATAQMEYSLDGLTWELIPGTVQGPNGSSPFSFYMDMDLTPLLSEHYSVRYTVVDGAGNSDQQTVIYQIDRTAPQAPENLMATSTPGSINLEWTMPADADIDYYRLYRAQAGTSFQFLQKVTGHTNVTYKDLTGVEGQEYQYRITAVDKFAQEGPTSNVVTITAASPMVITVHPAEISTGVESELWITVNKNGFPVVGGTVDVGSYAQGVSLDNNGQARVNVTPTSAGTIIVTAHDPENSQNSVSTTVTVGELVIPIDVTGVTLNTTSSAITVGESIALVARVTPVDATNQEVSWSTSQEDVAAVDAKGSVTGLSVGSAEITVTTTDGGFRDVCNVTVSQTTGGAINVTGVTLNTTSTAITVGESEALVATVVPMNATTRGAIWSSSDANVAAVTQTGVVTGVSPGSARITVTTVEGGFSDVCEVTVGSISVQEFVIDSLVKVGVNPQANDAAGIFVGIRNIRDGAGDPVLNSSLTGYCIELEFDPDKVKVLDVVDEANLESFSKTIEPSGKVTVLVKDSVALGSSDFASLFFVPIQLKGSVHDVTSITVRYIDLRDSNIHPVNSGASVVLNFQRGKILNEVGIQDLSIADAIAGLQYLANSRKAGPSELEVNLANMASIYELEGMDHFAKPNVKDIIALLQYLVHLRDVNLIMLAD